MRRVLAGALVLAGLMAPSAWAESSVPAVAWGNTFGCKPSAAHPRPVVLLHGLGARAQDNWRTIGPALKAGGYCVFAVSYGMDPRTRLFPYRPGGTIDARQSAPEIGAFVDRVLAATGAEEVDFVGHSEGTMTPRWYLERLGGADKVKRYVALTPLWRGTNIGQAALLRDAGGPLSTAVVNGFNQFCAFCPQAIQGSDFLDDLNADGEATPGVEHTNIATKYDELVQPYTSGIMRDGGTNIVLQDVCPTDFSEHGAVAFDPVVVQLVRNALDPEHAAPVSC
jgi:triacylglycerol esterase/lipase EstA (alpha/beta hydrolase family)